MTKTGNKIWWHSRRRRYWDIFSLSKNCMPSPISWHSWLYGNHDRWPTQTLHGSELTRIVKHAVLEPFSMFQQRNFLQRHSDWETGLGHLRLERDYIENYGFILRTPGATVAPPKKRPVRLMENWSRDDRNDTAGCLTPRAVRLEKCSQRAFLTEIHKYMDPLPFPMLSFYMYIKSFPEARAL